MISYGRQDVRQVDIEAVIKVLRSDYLTQGPVVPELESAISSRVGAKHAVAVNSATSALHIACVALGLGNGDRLWTVPITFVASANCGRYCGANVDFVDIDPATWNISLPYLEEKLFRARRENSLPKVVVPVHFSGQPTLQERIWELSREYGFRIVEDASHAVGASRNGEPVGSCRWSDIAVFSFHPVKIITAGEGGMALTNDPQIAERMSMLRSHGITRDSDRFLNPEDERGPWYYEQQLLGFNYRMTDIQAALCVSQLGRLDEYIERRNYLAQRYARKLRSLPLQLPTIEEGNRSAFHLYVVRMTEKSTSKTRRQVFDGLRDRGVAANLHYIPVHLQPYYRSLGFSPGQFPESEAYGRDAITLPLYPTLSDGDQDNVVRAVEQVLASD